MLCYMTPIRLRNVNAQLMKDHPAVIKARKAATYSLIRSGIVDRNLIRRMVKEIGKADFSLSSIDGCKAAITKGQLTF
jgi:hypothetical protein